MDKNLRTIPITFEKVQSYDVVDTRFTRCKIRLMHLGLNLNNSIFTKEVVEQALPSLCNTPILGYIKVDENGDRDFLDHHQVIIIEGKEIKVVYKGSAYGTIPESCNPRWEVIKCTDGIEREFLVVDGLLWNKIDGTDIFINDEVKKESMELFDNSITGHFDDDKHFVFDSFLFDGACALGEDTCPAMIDASISTNFSVNVDEIKLKLEQFNNYFSKQSQTPTGEDIDKGKTEGGQILTTETIDSIFAEFSLTRDEVNFEITDDTTEDFLRTYLSDFACKKKKNAKFDSILKEYSITREEIGEFSEDITEEDFTKLVSEFAENKAKQAEQPKKFSTYNEKREMLRGVLQDVWEYEGEGDNRKLKHAVEYYVSDFDDKFVYVSKDEYDGEKWEYSKGRFSYSITDNAASITGEFEPMIVKWITAEENAAIEKARSTFEANSAEFERLKKFEKDTLKNEFDANVKAIFAKFDSQLKDYAEYDVLKSNFSEMNLETIEEKCFALLGKKNANFSVNTNIPPVVNVGVDHTHEEPDDDGYGGLLSKKYNN